MNTKLGPSATTPTSPELSRRARFAVVLPDANGFTDEEKAAQGLDGDTAKPVGMPPVYWPVRIYFEDDVAFSKFIERRQAGLTQAIYMTVAEYARHRKLSKRTIENRIREGMPIEGRAKHRRVHVQRADEWFRSTGNAVVELAKANALRAVGSRS